MVEPNVDPEPTPTPEPVAGKQVTLSMPGVMPDPTPEADAIFEEFTAGDLNEPAVKFPDKGETGEEPTEPQAEPVAQATPGEEPPAGEGTPAATPLPDTIEGTPDEIMQKYKSLQGQFAGLNTQIGELTSELDAATSFFGLLRREGVIDEQGDVIVKAAPTGAPPGPPKTPQELSIADVVDFDFVADKLQSAIASGDKKSGDEAIAGMLVAVEQYVKKREENSNAALDKKLEGVTQMELNMKVMNQAAELFKQVGDTYDDKAKAYVYPELRDRKTSDQILEIWQTFDPVHAMTPRGVYDAWLEYKHRKGHFSGKAAPPTEPKVDISGAQKLLENKQKARRTTSDAILKGGGAAPVTPHTDTTASPDAITSAFLKRVKEAAKPIGSLGFAP